MLGEKSLTGQSSLFLRREVWTVFTTPSQLSASHFKRYWGSDKCGAVFRSIDNLSACFCMGRYLCLEPILPVATPVVALWRSTCKPYSPVMVSGSWKNQFIRVMWQDGRCLSMFVSLSLLFCIFQLGLELCSWSGGDAAVRGEPWQNGQMPMSCAIRMQVRGSSQVMIFFFFFFLQEEDLALSSCFDKQWLVSWQATLTAWIRWLVEMSCLLRLTVSLVWVYCWNVMSPKIDCIIRLAVLFILDVTFH